MLPQPANRKWTFFPQNNEAVLWQRFEGKILGRNVYCDRLCTASDYGFGFMPHNFRANLTLCFLGNGSPYLFTVVFGINTRGAGMAAAPHRISVIGSRNSHGYTRGTVRVELIYDGLAGRF